MVNLKVTCASDYKSALAQAPFVISYAFHDTPFGKCLIGLSGKYICHLSFVDRSLADNIQTLKSEWPGADFVEDAKGTADAVADVFVNKKDKVDVMMKGTPFQEQVWKGLLKVPQGKTCSYEAFAEMIGCPKAVRAAANAIAKNPVAFIVPCHRIISKSGNVHKYRWGTEKKQQLLEFEKTVLCSS